MKTTAIAMQAFAALAISISSADDRLDWNAHARNAIATARLEGGAAESAQALVRAAMSEASKRGNANGANGATATDHDVAAASVAAYVILECLFPEQQPALEAELAVALADFPETRQKAVALSAGRSAATDLLRSKSQACGTNLQAR